MESKTKSLADPAKLLIVPAILGHHGGLEAEVAAHADVARQAGFTVDILAPFTTRKDASIRATLPAGTSLIGAQDLWRRTAWGRVCWMVGYCLYLARQGKAPSTEIGPQIARTPSKPFVDRFWRNQGQARIRDAAILHLIGKPKDFLSEAIECAERLGTPSVYWEVADVDEEYAQADAHSKFHDVCNACAYLVHRTNAQTATLAKAFGYRGETRAVEQWAYGIEGELLALALPGRNKSAATVGVLCRQTDEKGIPWLLDAFAMAASNQPLLRMRIGGVGPRRADFVKHCNGLGIGDRVEWLGYINPQNRAEFYGSIDAFVISSPQEGGPITGLEAMAAGRAIISTPVGAMPSRLGGSSTNLVDYGDIDNLASAMERVANKEKTRQRGAWARQVYRQEHMSVTVSHQLLELWLRLI